MNLISFIPQKYHGKNSPQWLLYFLLSLIASLGVIFLQETRNKPTINTLEDVINQSNTPSIKLKIGKVGEDQVELLRAEEMDKEDL